MATTTKRLMVFKTFIDNQRRISFYIQNRTCDRCTDLATRIVIEKYERSLRRSCRYDVLEGLWREVLESVSGGLLWQE